MALCGEILGIVNTSKRILQMNNNFRITSDDLQKEHNEDLTFPNLKNILFKYSTLFKILY